MRASKKPTAPTVTLPQQELLGVDLRGGQRRRYEQFRAAKMAAEAEAQKIAASAETEAVDPEGWFEWADDDYLPSLLDVHDAFEEDEAFEEEELLAGRDEDLFENDVI